MPYIRLTTYRKVMLIVLGLALALAPLSLLPLFLEELVISLRNIGLGIYLITSTKVNILLVSTLIMTLMPYAIVDFMNRRYVDIIDKTIPAFFKGISESIRAGMTFLEALRNAALTIGGPLGREIERALVRVEFGATIEDSLYRLAQEIKLPNLRRAITILITAHESGGKIIDVLDSAAEMYGIIRAYEEEKRVTLNPYAITVYVAMLLYLFIIYIITYTMFIPLSRMAAGTTFLRPVDIGIYKAVLFYSSTIEAIFGGLMVGKLKVGKVSAGLIHIVILLLIVIAFFTFVELYGEYLVFTPQFSRP